MPFKAKFIGGLQLGVEKADMTLTMIVSKDNTHQTGDELLAFINLVNCHKKIKKLRVIVSDYLNRHYVGEEAALLWGEQWITTHAPLFENLSIPYKIDRWREFFDKKPEYATLVDEIGKMPSRNKQFATILDDTGLRHAGKAGWDAAKNYLIEDCASAVVLSPYNIAYPAKKLNKAIQYVLQAFNKKMNYYGYAVSFCNTLTKAPVSNSGINELLFFSLFQTQKLMTENGIDHPEIQVRFFESFLKNREIFAAECKKKKIILPNHNDDSNEVQDYKIQPYLQLNQ